MNFYSSFNSHTRKQVTSSTGEKMPLRTSISFLYESFLGRLLFNEEPHSIWTCCSNPYSRSSGVSLASTDTSILEDADKVTYVQLIPRCKLYRGLILQGYLISPKFLASLDSFTVRPDDLFIASYPRSGTTWTEEIVSAISSKMDQQYMSQAIHDRVVHLEVGRTCGQGRHLKSLKSPRILSTHLPFTHCPSQLKQMKCKVIYIIRNPKDQAVSYYHFHSTAQYLGSHCWQFDQFISLYMKGIMCYGSWFDHVTSWLDASIQYPQSILVISYEELQVNLSGMIKLIATFLDAQLTDEVVNSIVKHCQFTSMKFNRATNREETPLSDLFKASRFMRKGLIGDWKHHFTPQQAATFDKLCQEKLAQFNLNLPCDYTEAVKMFKVNKLRVFDHAKIHLDDFDKNHANDHLITLQPKSLKTFTSCRSNSSPIEMNNREISCNIQMNQVNERDKFHPPDEGATDDIVVVVNDDDEDEDDVQYERPNESLILKPKLSLIKEEAGVYDTVKSQMSLITNESNNITTIDENNVSVKPPDTKATIVDYNWSIKVQSDESVK